METQLKKKYGLLTAISMVVGIVIGSGVFFKAEKILTATGGNLPLGILAWVIGGVIMIVCAFTFSVMANRYERVNGIVDYAEAALGKGYGYFTGWFMATIYYPTLTAVLAWVSARYTCVLLGWNITGGECMTIAAFFLVAAYALNTLSPILAGKFQVSATAIKLVPLALMAVVGTVVGLVTATGKFKQLDPSAEDGTQVAAGVLLQACDATLIDRDDGLVVARHAIVAHHALAWPDAITTAEKLTAIAQLKALGVLVRQGA